MLITCKKATELIESEQEKKLTFKNVIKLNVHLIMCKVCSAYKKQSHKINNVLSNYLKSDPSKTEKHIEDLKDKIKSKL